MTYTEEAQNTYNQDSDQQVTVSSHETEETHVYEGNTIKHKALAVFGAFVVTGLVTTFAFGEIKVEQTIPKPIPETRIIERAPTPPHTTNPLEEVSVIAEAAIVYDVHQGRVLFKKNANKVMGLASLTKLMTALLAVESLTEESSVAITPGSLAVEGDSGLYVNETWNIRDLIHFTMISSSNDGANALATAVGSLWQSTPTTHDESDQVRLFVNRMNFRADELGLQDTRYANPTGLDDFTPGGRGTANDMAKLLAYIWKHEPEAIAYTNIEKKTFTSLDNFIHDAENTNVIVNTIPGMIGGKTGYTDKSGGNLAVIYDAGLDHPIAVVVLGSTREGRFKDVETLVDSTYDYLSSGWFEYETQMSDSTKQTKGSAN